MPTPRQAPPTDDDPLLSQRGFWLAILILVFLTGITIFLVDHYSNDSASAVNVLGLITPVLTAVIGLGAGLGVGQKAGKAAGADEEKRRTRSQAAQIKDALDDASSAYDDIRQTLTTAGESTAGASTLQFAGPADSHEVKIDDLDRATKALAAARAGAESLVS